MHNHGARSRISKRLMINAPVMLIRGYIKIGFFILLHSFMVNSEHHHNVTFCKTIAQVVVSIGIDFVLRSAGQFLRTNESYTSSKFSQK